jgi:hypothetical protein
VQLTLPQNMRGWDTGTVEISEVRLDINEDKRELFEPQPAKLRILTLDSSELLPKKEARVEGSSVTWDLDERVRMPIYARYQSSIAFEIGSANKPTVLGSLGVAKEPAAVAILWMQDLTDDVEQEVKVPVLVSKDFATLRQNAVNDQTKKHHDLEVVGFVCVRLRLDSGLDEDHEVSRERGRG